MFELECLTDAAASQRSSCVPDCPCQPDQRENECWPYFVSEPEPSEPAPDDVQTV